LPNPFNLSQRPLQILAGFEALDSPEKEQDMPRFYLDPARERNRRREKVLKRPQRSREVRLDVDVRRVASKATAWRALPNPFNLSQRPLQILAGFEALDSPRTRAQSSPRESSQTPTAVARGTSRR
jgi:hypothetical protein